MTHLSNYINSIIEDNLDLSLELSLENLSKSRNTMKGMDIQKYLAHLFQDEEFDKKLSSCLNSLEYTYLLEDDIIICSNNMIFRIFTNNLFSRLLSYSIKEKTLDQLKMETIQDVELIEKAINSKDKIIENNAKKVSYANKLISKFITENPDLDFQKECSKFLKKNSLDLTGGEEEFFANKIKNTFYSKENDLNDLVVFVDNSLELKEGEKGYASCILQNKSGTKFLICSLSETFIQSRVIKAGENALDKMYKDLSIRYNFIPKSFLTPCFGFKPNIESINYYFFLFLVVFEDGVLEEVLETGRGKDITTIVEKDSLERLFKNFDNGLGFAMDKYKKYVQDAKVVTRDILENK